MARTILNIACGVVLLSTLAYTQPANPADEMGAAAIKFLDSLHDEQEQAARFAFDSDDRFDWHFIPRERKGVPLKAMTSAQRSAALDLVRVGLSETGFTKAEAIRQLEQILFELEGRDIRDPDLYFFMIFGDPSGNTWGWRYEGHHLSHSWTIVNGEVAATPQFFGTNPAEVREGPKRGQRVLGTEEDEARALLTSLNTQQRSAAMLSDEAPRDILTSAEREVAMLDDLGVAYADLDGRQQEARWAIVDEYASAQPAPVAEARLAEVRAAGLAPLKFGWMGSPNRGEAHYYRIQGSNFMIEYDNTQGNANHVHSVWRDFRGDFGRDLLAEHYEAFTHQPLLAN